MLTLLLIGGVLLIVILLVVGVVITVREERSLIDDRLDTYLEEPSFTTSYEGDEDQEKKSFLTSWLNNRMEGSSYASKIQNELAQADMKFKAGEFVALQIIMAFVSALLGFIFSGGAKSLGEKDYFPIIFAVIFFALGTRIPHFMIKFQQRKRMKTFGYQLPEMLNLMVNGLRAGFSTMQAMEAVSKELPSPISDEFRRVVQEMQLGLPMEAALDNLLRRIPSTDLDLVITAINVQREVGGNLAEVLEKISHTIRERIKLKGEIRAMTSQARYSGIFLSLIPVIMTAILFMINRPYMEVLIAPSTRWCGIPLMVCSGLMIFAGYSVMAKMADIDM